jgi:hypothetical protein
MGEQGYGIDVKRLNEYATQIKEVADLGVQIGIVIGGGNIFRGLSGAQKGFDRVKGDQMGMLATVINALALASALEAIGQPVRVLTSVRMEPIGDFYSPAKAQRLLDKGNVVIINGPPVSAVQNRVEGCMNELKLHPNIKLLSHNQNAKGSREGGLEIMTSLLSANPKTKSLGRKTITHGNLWGHP